MESNESSGYAVRTHTGRLYRLPIDKKQYNSLLSFVDEMTAMLGCDNTLDHAESWARAHRVGWARLGRTLRTLGCCCDCEIGMNLTHDDD